MRDPSKWAEQIGTDDTVLVTGAAGFVGYHLCGLLTEAGIRVVGLDNMNDYYDQQLKYARLKRLLPRPLFEFERVDLMDRQELDRLFKTRRPRYVVNLAAQAGVRFSIEKPHAYGEGNLVGFINLLEACRHNDIVHLIYASTSSVYGGNTRLPFSVDDSVDHPVSLYAATKKANELMAHCYAHLYGLPSTGLRFFTVYGPWGRPDMAYFKFTEKILKGEPIQVFNQGNMERDFTYVSDIVEGVARLIPHVPEADPTFDSANPTPASSWAPHRVYNIGNRCREKLMDLISHLEELLGRPAVKEYLPMQPGDLKATWADIAALEKAVDFRPATPLREGLTNFVDWYREFYEV